MSKVKTPKPPFVEDLETVLRVPLTSFIELLNSEDLDTILAPWIALEYYNLDKEGMDPDEDLAFPQAIIYASITSSETVSAFYVVVIGEDSQYLYSVHSLSIAVELVRDLRGRYREALNQQLL